MLAWETEWSEVTIHWSRKEGLCLMAENFANGHESSSGRELRKIACKAADLHSRIMLEVMFPVLGLEHASSSLNVSIY